jgi:hypothetical protein
MQCVHLQCFRFLVAAVKLVFIYCTLSANDIEFLYLLTRIETLKNRYIF